MTSPRGSAGPAARGERPPRPRWRAGTAGAALLSLLLGACGLPAPPRLPSPAVRPPEPADTLVERYPLEVELRPVAAPAPPGPWLGARVSVAPASPREGGALAVRVEPRGRSPLAVTGRLGGDRRVRFGRLPDGAWLGLAPLPVGDSGTRRLVIRLEVASDSTLVTRRAVRVSGHRFPASSLSVAPRYSRPPDSVRGRIERERRAVADALSSTAGEWLWRGRFTWPRKPRITSPFGVRRVFNGELRSRHWGLDLAGRVGDPVRAAARGRVVLARHLYYGGKTVLLDHGHGVVTGYSHLSEVGVGVGDTVESGQVVGAVGATGRVTGPHLHWTLRVDGVRLDASSLLELDVY